MPAFLYPKFRILAFWTAICIAFPGAIPALGQVPADLEARRLAAYQRFHRGEVAGASTEVRALANETADTEKKTLLLRDLVEICWTGYDAACAQDASVEALNYAAANERLKFLIPELQSYLIGVQVWFNNTEFLEKFIDAGGAGKLISPAQNPVAAATTNLALHDYFVKTNNRQAAESAYSSAVLSLLLLDPKNKHGIATLLIELLEALFAQQDTVGAASLITVAEPFLTGNLDHQGPHYAKYRLLAAQLLALGNVHTAAPAALSEASRLVERQDIDENVRTYRLAANSSLASLALVLSGKLPEAIRLHSTHPLYAKRDEILGRGEFQTHQELYFAISDTVLKCLDRQPSAREWKPLLEKVPKWQIEKLEERNIESYRNFALGLIAASDSQDDARGIYQTSGWQRIENFEAVLKNRYEGFQLPSSIDLLVLKTALTSAIKDPASKDFDLLLKGSEILSRTLRHQLSDFAVLLGSQKVAGSRNRAQSYKLIAQQKRNWELEKIGELLAGRPTDRGAVIVAYTDLVQVTSRLKQDFSENADYQETAGYPGLQQMQEALHPDEVFITYVPTLEGLGRVCITKATATKVFSPYDQNQVRSDIKLLQFSLTADHAPDRVLDSQFPVEAALRLKGALFGGLEPCMKPGSHVNIALPEDVAGIPVGVLLGSAPKRLEDGYDLANADWMANNFSFSVTISARHFLGTRNLISKQTAPFGYLGIGDPALASNNETKSASRATNAMLSALPALPETAQELSTVGRLLEANGLDLLLGGRATEEALRSKSLGSYDVIHFATHGLLKGEVTGLAEPALVLTAGEQGDSFDDGLLSSSEISRFSLNARLVVLSACNSAKFDTNALSAGAADLQSAFSIAGAPALLAALWTIDSSSARDLMIEFFKAWNAQTDKSASKAMANATRAYRKGADQAHQHPRFWGPFIVFGQGHDLPRQTPGGSGKENDLEVAPEGSAGEVVDAQMLGDDVVLSSIGDWNGTRMAGIITRISERPSSRWTARSYDVAAGKLVIGDDFLLALGSAGPRELPVLTRLGADGQIIWRREFEEFSGLLFVGGALMDGEIFVLADSFPLAQRTPRLVVMIKLSKDGVVLSRQALDAEEANSLLGRGTFLASNQGTLAIAVVSQAESKFDSAQSGALGLPPWCPGAAQTTLRLMRSRALETDGVRIDGFQAHWIGYVNGRLMVAGNVRDRCSRTGAPAVYEIDGEGKPKLAWSGMDQFASAVRGIYQNGDRLNMLISRMRPTGIRKTAVSEPAGGPKRWGELDGLLMEYSILSLDKAGTTKVEHASSFGNSAYLGGTLDFKGRHFVFGSVGGRPALSRELLLMAR